MLPINAMAQKVVPGSESGSMKPLTGSGLSYVTLQPPSQPLSLVQDHRPSVYQTPPYIGSNMEKEPEAEKLIPNGVEITKTETEQDVPAVVKQNESNRNNNLSPETPAQEQPCEMPSSEPVLPSLIEFPISTPVCTPAQNKVEEKKVPVNNGSKESEGKAVNTTVHIKQSPHKPEETQTKSEVPKVPKQSPTNQSSKVPSDNAAATTLTSTFKPDAKVTTSPKTTKRKSRELKDLKATSVVTDGASKPKRNRIQTQPYQSPLPEIALLVKNLNKTTPGPSKAADDKLIVFYKNEFLAVRNAEGSFYVCQAMQNIYKSSRRIRIRWLSQDKTNGEIYSPDFYDTIDFDCILTNLNLSKVDKHKFWLTRIELLRTENILKRAIDVEAGVSEKPRVTEEHPDGLDLSLYKDESQLKRRKGLHSEKSNRQKKSKRVASSTDDEADEEESDRNRKASKASRAKKRSVKALAIAKSVAKGSSRAERALNRSTKSGNSLDNDLVTTTVTAAAATAAATTVATTVTAGTAIATTTAASAPATAATTTTTTTTVNPATNVSAVTDTKNNVEKKLDLKKNGKQQSNNGTRGVPRTKPGDFLTKSN
ncbi:PREDICTED: uncharacterized protein LOC105458198 isoform X2 [Wasmannia auropunctata]|uniref:uncharacterized protein LOC105458198 isoform X2 n=1 Tax=Wasmannia auropunctata TaxID=64793 RepID=UPI0005F03DBC|nr:PREDICTED: uncharacterized protein LOC105458198 isoform X2 [Wasmannia auropunctata]